ncbi:hypothetical protein TthTF19_17450 [Thermus thermophilus]
MFLLATILFLASCAGGAVGTAASLYLARLDNPFYLGLQHAIGWGASVLALFTGYLLDRTDRKKALTFGLLSGSLLRFLRVLLDPNPWGVKKEGVPCSKIVSTPSTILTQRPFSWLPTSG